MHDQYKSLLTYVKHSYEYDPMDCFFQKVIDLMKKIKALARIDFGNFRIYQGSRL